MDQRFIRVDFEFILEHIVCDHLVMNPQDLTGLFWSSLCVMSCLCWHYKVSVLTLHKPDQFDLNFSGSCMYPLGSSGCRCVLSLSLFNIFSCLLLLVHGWDWALSNTGASGSSHWLKLKYEKKVLLFFFFFFGTMFHAHFVCDLDFFGNAPEMCIVNVVSDICQLYNLGRAGLCNSV